MRYLITSNRSEAKVILGYDGEGLLYEVQVENMPEADHRLWPFRHAPLREADLKAVFGQNHLKIQTLNVTIDEFWKKYGVKEGKKETMGVWERMPEAKRQLAFSYIDSYRAKCNREGIRMQYPATYLRAERWIDHT